MKTKDLQMLKIFENTRRVCIKKKVFFVTLKSVYNVVPNRLDILYCQPLVHHCVLIVYMEYRTWFLNVQGDNQIFAY